MITSLTLSGLCNLCMNAPTPPPTHTDGSVKSLLGPNKRQALLHDHRFIEHTMTIVFLKSCAQPKML